MVLSERFVSLELSVTHMHWEPLHPPSPPPLPALVTFIGDRTQFFRLAAKGAALEVVTAGFYRFWLATDIRRHLWSNTVIDGDAAEYTGRGRELLIGFLFAIAILVPIYLAYFLVTVEAERVRGFASVPLLLAFYGFGQFAIYRARRYRLTRTVWRGVRFWMDGSGWAYAWRAMLWSLLTVVTLGLALPWREAALERYKMSHSYYGDVQGEFDGSPWEFFKSALHLWVAAVVTIVLFPLFPFVYARFKAAEWRWWLSGIRFGNVLVESDLPENALQAVYWKVIGWYFLLVIALSIFIGIGTAIVGSITGAFHQPHLAGAAALSKSIPLIAMTVIGYLALILSLNVVLRVYLVHDVWAKVLQSVRVENIAAVADVAAKGDLANALGEGFADGLDVAGF
jgi:uncharacterized membrane protein YjgN (DUF898 family)